MATLEELLKQATDAQQKIDGLRDRLSHVQSYTDRRTLQNRIRSLEDQITHLQYEALKKAKGNPATVFGTRKKAKTVAGISVRVDISTDGKFFSNPAPKISNGHRVWVRCQMDMAQKSPFSTKKTEIPNFIRCTWVIPRGWTSLDRYSKYGRVEFVVSMPLVITREFHAPSSGSTKANFGVWCDPYHQVDTTAEPPDTADVELSTVDAVIAAGSYLVYTRTGNVFSSRASQSFADSTIRVAEDDEALLYTDLNITLSLREMQSGSFAGKYIDVSQDGITLNEAIGSIV